MPNPNLIAPNERLIHRLIHGEEAESPTDANKKLYLRNRIRLPYVAYIFEKEKMYAFYNREYNLIGNTTCTVKIGNIFDPFTSEPKKKQFWMDHEGSPTNPQATRKLKDKVRRFENDLPGYTRIKNNDWGKTKLVLEN